MHPAHSRALPLSLRPDHVSVRQGRRSPISTSCHGICQPTNNAAMHGPHVSTCYAQDRTAHHMYTHHLATCAQTQIQE